MVTADVTFSTQNNFDPSTVPMPTLHACQILPEMSFAQASEVFLDWLSSPMSPQDARYRSFRTMRDIRTKLKALAKFFGPLKLSEIHIGHLREYQKTRFTNGRGLWAHTAGANKVNAETGLVLRIMKLGEAYTPTIEKYFVTLRVDECEIPKALTPDEQDRFLGVAKDLPGCELVYWYSLVALHVAFSSDELRTLRQGDVNMAHQTISVNRRAGKNKHRRRTVPITDASALWALERLLERSIRLVGHSPQLYLFPARIARNSFTGERHMGETGMRKQFEAVRQAADLESFCFNGWRHTAITRMAEAGIPIATIMARAGHCSPKMTAHYTHISEQAERQALQRMATPRSTVRNLQVLNLSDPAIQAEIARQVAIAMQREATRNEVQIGKAGRLISFPDFA
jgi:integrase